MTTMSGTGRFRKAGIKVRIIAALVAAVWFDANTGNIIPYGHSATTERIVADTATGLAISGFDPVGYFTDSAAKFGRPEIEQSFGGAVWRFLNAGNRAAFVAHPEVYMPRFGGYDPVAASRGKSVAGHPLHWAISDRRLYLFYDKRNRAEFLADADRIVAEAERRWPQVKHNLTP